jgi:hypothetical protein
VTDTAQTEARQAGLVALETAVLTLGLRDPERGAGLCCCCVIHDSLFRFLLPIIRGPENQL